ncbi:MAG: hypothetical protein HS111_12890 [Kofleriaceae bacterium]|nr:hypothetical protein [Kofleriaceae bacterium]
MRDDVRASIDAKRIEGINIIEREAEDLPPPPAAADAERVGTSCATARSWR